MEGFEIDSWDLDINIEVKAVSPIIEIIGCSDIVKLALNIIFQLECPGAGV